MAAGASHETYDSPYVNYMMMDNYYVYGGYDGADWHGFYYDITTSTKMEPTNY